MLQLYHSILGISPLVHLAAASGSKSDTLLLAEGSAARLLHSFFVLTTVRLLEGRPLQYLTSLQPVHVLRASPPLPDAAQLITIVLSIPVVYRRLFYSSPTALPDG